ncbi:sigma-70 family RNA polymerase sigma factor [Variovorax ginsengisoli]|uniref:RNA polymerase sigma factor (Sigma-70 family) n=1 Tax=Variovorax ginsengisoli TaxID=363844 RepID=A0ABT9S4H4_9BURK|nr:sigma-70 family RNA polymerase sigma factor [Variovorax ginsengisoli]MDP9899245.1 RNA polymerase sigma factor (sigma-70 family) [Variovorax ginsengisoli]
MSPEATARSPLLESFRLSYRDLLRYLAHRTGSADDARDLAHDTWLKLAELAQQGALPSMTEGSEARAYLFAVARNLCIDRQRRDQVAHRHAQAHPGSEAGGPDATEALMYRQAVTAIEAALAGLPERPRQVFLRHRVHGEDQSALAAEYGVSRNMIERDMIRAMDLVQAAMERWHASSIANAVPATPAAPTMAMRRGGRRRSLAALLGVAGLTAGLGGWQWWRVAVPQWQELVSTGLGRSLRRVLPDGSVMTLDARTQVRAAYDAADRRVRLMAGAVFLEVVRDARRPFVVDVPGERAADGSGPTVRITVLGTRFGVDRLSGKAVDVQVESGRVRVDVLDAAGRVQGTQTLHDGEALRVFPGAAGGAFARMALATEAAAWRHGMLALSDMPLDDAVARLERYLPRPVAVDARVAGLRLSGQVRIAQAEDFLRALPDILPVRSTLEAGRWAIGPRKD